MIITKWNHPDVEQNQQTNLSQQANTGESTLTVLNTKGITTNQLLLVGSFGSENAEIVKTHATTAPTDTVVTLAAALKFNHSTDTIITVLDYDQIEIYRATSKGGSYSLVTTVDIMVDEDGTTYKDSNASTTDYYKIRYKNSINSSFSGYSVEIPATGLKEDTLAGTVETVYRLFSKHSKKVLDKSDIVQWLNEGYETLIVRIADLDIDYNVKYGTDGNGAIISFIANQRAYPLPADFIKPRRLFFSYNGVKYYPADPMDSSFDHPDNVYLKTKPKYYLEGKKIVPLPKPLESSGGILPRYYAMPARMENDDDAPDLPTGYYKLLPNFALKRALESDRQFEMANYYGGLFENGAELMLSEIKNRTPEMPQMIYPWGISIEDDYNDGFQIPG